MKITNDETEKAISELIRDADISNETANHVSYLLGSILTAFFANQERGSGLRSWTVDDMYPDKVEVSTRKVSLTGRIHWLGGGGDCVNYQASIARDTNPLLYSVRLQSKRGRQLMYIGKTFKGWILNIE